MYNVLNMFSGQKVVRDVFKLSLAQQDPGVLPDLSILSKIAHDKQVRINK